MERRAVDASRDRLGVRSDVEAVWTTLRETHEQGRKGRVPDQRSDRQRITVGAVENRSRLGRHRAGAAAGVQRIVEPRRDLEAIARKADRWLEQCRPRQFAVAPVRKRHHPDVSGNADALAAGYSLVMSHWLAVLIEPGSCRSMGRGLASVEGNGSGAAGRIDEVTSSADARALRLNDVE